MNISGSRPILSQLKGYAHVLHNIYQPTDFEALKMQGQSLKLSELLQDVYLHELPMNIERY